MALTKTRKNFLDTEEGRAIKSELQAMVTNKAYITTPGYSANAMLYPDHQIPFVDLHMDYIIKHPVLEASKYLANVKLMTRVR